MIKKETENLDKLPFPDSRAPTPTKLLTTRFWVSAPHVISFTNTEYCFPSICGVRWQGPFSQRLKKKQSRSPVHSLGVTSIRPFSQLLPVWRLPPRAGSTWPGQAAQDKATTPEGGNWGHSNRTGKAQVHVTSAGDLIQALGQVTAYSILNSFCLRVPLKEGLWGLIFAGYFSDGHHYLTCCFPPAATNSSLHTAVTPSARVFFLWGRKTTFPGWQHVFFQDLMKAMTQSFPGIVTQCTRHCPNVTKWMVRYQSQILQVYPDLLAVWVGKQINSNWKSPNLKWLGNKSNFSARNQTSLSQGAK